MQPRIEFWYEFASTYSYLSAMRIEDMAQVHGVDVVWRPFLLGPIFGSQGWTTSPFNIYPAKGRYMVRDIERIAAMRGLSFRIPEPFPQNSLLAARLALTGADAGWGPAFSIAMYLAQFADGKTISEPSVVAEILTALHLDSKTCFGHAETAEIKAQLNMQTERAASLGIFGAPSFTTDDGELFWGDDRLEMALDWATSK